jgi:hypothetical protein
MSIKKKTLISNNQFFIFYNRELIECDSRAEALDYINKQILPKYDGRDPASVGDDLILIEGATLEITLKRNILASIRH